MSVGSNFGERDQIIIALGGVLLTLCAGLLGHYIPIWIGQSRRWFRDRKQLLHENESAMATLSAVIRERDELRATLNAASQGAGINQGLIDALQTQIDDMKTLFTTKLSEAVQYCVELTIHIMDGGNPADMPEPPESISHELRDQVNLRLERRKETRS